jgi:hypothetical protein
LSGFGACFGWDSTGVMKTTAPAGLPLPTYDIVWEGFDHRDGMSVFLIETADGLVMRVSGRITSGNIFPSKN